jgi:hypothetical protein
MNFESVPGLLDSFVANRYGELGRSCQVVIFDVCQ